MCVFMTFVLFTNKIEMTLSCRDLVRKIHDRNCGLVGLLCHWSLWNILLDCSCCYFSFLENMMLNESIAMIIFGRSYGIY